MTWQQFTESGIGKHIIMFARMYITVFLSFYLRDIALGAQEGQDFVLLNWTVIVPSLKWSLLAVIQNVYQLIAPPVKRTAGAIFRRGK